MPSSDGGVGPGPGPPFPPTDEEGRPSRPVRDGKPSIPRNRAGDKWRGGARWSGPEGRGRGRAVCRLRRQGKAAPTKGHRHGRPRRDAGTAAEGRQRPPPPPGLRRPERGETVDGKRGSRSGGRARREARRGRQAQEPGRRPIPEASEATKDVFGKACRDVPSAQPRKGSAQRAATPQPVAPPGAAARETPEEVLPPADREAPGPEGPWSGPGAAAGYGALGMDGSRRRRCVGPGTSASRAATLPSVRASPSCQGAASPPRGHAAGARPPANRRWIAFAKYARRSAPSEGRFRTSDPPRLLPPAVPSTPRPRKVAGAEGRKDLAPDADARRGRPSRPRGCGRGRGTSRRPSSSPAPRPTGFRLQPWIFACDP